MDTHALMFTFPKKKRLRCKSISSVLASIAAGALFFAVVSQAGTPGAPEGWTKDNSLIEKYGVVGYKADDGHLRVYVGPAKPPSADSAESLMNEFLAEQARQFEIDVPTPVSVVKGDGFESAIGTIIRNKGKRQQRREIYTCVVRPGQPVQWIEARPKSGERITSNDSEFLNQLASTATLETFDPFAQSKAPKSRSSSASKATRKKERKANNTEANRIRKAITTAPGEGLKPSELRGLYRKLGDMKYDTFSGIWEEKGAATYLLLTDGWAYKNPQVAPADLNVAASREPEPRRWSKWTDNKELREAKVMEPLERGYRIDISVHRPRRGGTLGMKSSTTGRLKLTRNGRFETSIFSIAESDFGDGTTTVAVAESREGRTATGSGDSGNVSSTQLSRSGGRGNHSGTYAIEGNTIELRYDDGTVVRKPFGTDGIDDVILGKTNYWVPRD